MPTQTGSIDFKSTKGLKSYAEAQFATSEQVTTLNTAIEQNAKDIALRATKTDFALNSKGTNLYAVANQTNGYLAGTGTSIASPDSTMLEVTSDFIPIGGASTVSIQTWVEQSRVMWMAYSFYTTKDMSTTTSRPSKTTTGTYLAFENVAVPSTANYIRVAYRSYGEGRCKVELDGLTAWSEAPADTNIYAVKAEIKVANDAISLRATKDEVEKTYSTKEDSQLDRAGSGTSVTIEGAANAALKGLHILGESAQDGTPTPSAPVPIVSVSGANILVDSDTGHGWSYSTFNASTCEYTRSTTATGESYVQAKSMKFEAGQTYTLSCWAKSNGYVRNLDLFKVHSSGSGSHQSRTGISLTTEYQRISWTFTCNATTTETAYIRFDNNGSTTSGTEAILYIKEPQLVVGAGAGVYVPTGALGIWVKGKNLLRPLLGAQGAVAGITYTPNVDGSYTASGTATANSQIVGVRFRLTAGTYRLSGFPSGQGDVITRFLRVIIYADATSTSIITTATDIGSGVTFTLDADRYVAVFSNISNGQTVSGLTIRPQIELGSESTEYEPYIESVTPIPLNGHELRSLPDGTQDELTVDTDGHVTMTQRVGSVTLDGSESWTMVAKSSSYSGYSGSYLGYAAAPTEAASPVSGGLVAFCNKYSVPNPARVALYTDDSAAINNSSVSGARRVFVFDPTLTSSVADFKAVLASSPMELTYPLVTSQTIDLGTIDMPQVHDGDTVEVIAALTPSIDVTWWASAGQAVADAYASLSSAIEVRAESIVSTVSERYATSQEVQAISSQITQTAQSWTAQFNELTGGADLSMTLAQAFETLGVTSDNLEEIRSFVRITTDGAGDPLLLMGSATSPIMLALSNDSLRFMHGSDPVAYIDVDGTTNEGRLHITRAVVVKELQFGSWKWFERDNGNMALKWVGDE